jgi:hypothetical protein
MCNEPRVLCRHADFRSLRQQGRAREMQTYFGCLACARGRKCPPERGWPAGKHVPVRELMGLSSPWYVRAVPPAGGEHDFPQAFPRRPTCPLCAWRPREHLPSYGRPSASWRTPTASARRGGRAPPSGAPPATTSPTARSATGTAARGRSRRPRHTHSIAQHSTAQHSTAQHSTAQHSTAQHSTAQHSTAQHSTAQHSTVRPYAVLWYAMLSKGGHGAGQPAALLPATAARGRPSFRPAAPPVRARAHALGRAGAGAAERRRGPAPGRRVRPARAEPALCRPSPRPQPARREVETPPTARRRYWITRRKLHGIAPWPGTGGLGGKRDPLRNRGSHYFHSSFVDLVLGGLVGVRPTRTFVTRSNLPCVASMHRAPDVVAGTSSCGRSPRSAGSRCARCARAASRST